MELIADAGYAPVDLGGTASCEVMEMPSRPGPSRRGVPPAGRREGGGGGQAGEEIPPTPSYGERRPASSASST